MIPSEDYLEWQWTDLSRLFTHLRIWITTDTPILFQSGSFAVKTVQEGLVVSDDDQLEVGLMFTFLDQSGEMRERKFGQSESEVSFNLRRYERLIRR